MPTEYKQIEDRYELLGFDKWNRRLLNLYWIYNVIVLATELALLYLLYTIDSLWYPINYHLINFILLPTMLVLGITALCEGVVWILKRSHRDLIPYVMTFACVAYCSILHFIHYSVVVLSTAYVIPVIISLVYDSKSVLRWTSFCSFTAFFIVCFVIMNFVDPQFVRIDMVEIITASALLITIRLLCETILNRNRNIIDTLVETKHSESRAEATAEARARFLANMSHEIRTPMNGIIGLAELALDDQGLSKRQKDSLAKIHSSAGGLLHIVNDILDISKIDEGEFKLENIPFDLQEVLDQCRTVIGWNADEKGLRMKFDTDTHKIDMVMGDPTKLRQALLNLLSNAVKFTEKGLVTFTVKGERLPSGMVSARFEIADTGIGMTKQQLAVVFEPFKQADDCTTREYGGTGLGLSITKSIVEKMGGQIQVESTQGVGSRFSFELVFALAEPAPKAIKGTHFSKLVGNVLVCEDNEINNQVALESLKKLGLTVIVAENGKLGIEEVYKHGIDYFDVILMDIQMPVMDGFQTTSKLMEMGVESPIIAMTANVVLENRERCVQSGMVDFIAKPFNLRDLWQCLAKYLTPLEDKLEINSEQNTDNTIEPAIDIQFGIANSADSEDLHIKMLTRFFNNGLNTYVRLENAIAGTDYYRANQIVHLERGTVQIIGAKRLSELLVELESAIKRNAEVDCNRIMADYKTELENVLNYISDTIIKN